MMLHPQAILISEKLLSGVTFQGPSDYLPQAKGKGQTYLGKTRFLTRHSLLINVLHLLYLHKWISKSNFAKITLIVSVIYCCVTQLGSLKQQILPHGVPESQASSRSLAGWFWLWVSREVAVKRSARASVSEDSTGAGGFTSTLSNVGRRLQSLNTWASIGLFTVRLLHESRKIIKGRVLDKYQIGSFSCPLPIEREASVSPILILTVTYYHSN